MVQEEKQLLLQDLCARLPYGVKVKYAIPTLLVSVRNDRDGIKVITEGTYNEHIYNIEDIKPYLRSMSTMTKEEKEELVDFGLAYWDNGKHTDENGNTIIYGGKEIQLIPDIETYEWLNRYHFDYRGLIPKGLAIEAPEDMYC